MVVAVPAVRVVEMAIDKIVDVIAMRDRLVPTTRIVYVSRFVPITTICGKAGANPF